MWQTQMVLLEGKTLLVFVPVVFTCLLTNNIKHDKLTNNMHVEKLWKLGYQTLTQYFHAHTGSFLSRWKGQLKKNR